MAERKKHILIFIDWFEPGYKAGGPIRSVLNLIDVLHETYDFSIVTTDRDLGDQEPYPGVETTEWIQRDHYRIWYASPEHRSYRHIRNHIFNTAYDMLYVQSMFSLRFSFFPLWTSRALTPDAKMILAPRGMLHAGALGFKTRKKRLFLWLFRLLRLHTAVTFQATDAQEVKDIGTTFGDVDIHLAPNLPRTTLPPTASLAKDPGSLRLVYISRISEKKGLHLALEALRNITSQVVFDLYGVHDEPAYWERCEALIAALPANITVTFKGPIPPAEVAETIQRYHAFTMPTRGENFGHAIFEALAAGRPVVISDQTPWQDLEAQNAGWDLPLSDDSGLKPVFENLAHMDAAAWQIWSNGARNLATAHLDALNLNVVRELFTLPEPSPEG